MSGNAERLLMKEFPNCPYCGLNVCWQGVDSIHGHPPNPLNVYFTPEEMLSEMPGMKRVAIMRVAGRMGADERMATLEELGRIGWIRCFDCARILKPHENENDEKLFYEIMKLGERIVRE